MDFDKVIQLLTIILPYILGIVVPLVTTGLVLRNNRKMKEMDLKQKELDRKSSIKNQILVKSIDLLAESYHKVHKINAHLNNFYGLDENHKNVVVDELISIRTYWERNLLFFPPSIKKEIIPFTNFAFSSLTETEIGYKSQQEAFKKVSELFKKIDAAFEAIISQYSVFEEGNNY